MPTQFAWDEKSVDRSSNGRFTSPGKGSKSAGTANRSQMEEDQSPETSPSGAKLVDFNRNDPGKKGQAIYADGAVATMTPNGVRWTLPKRRSSAR